MKTNLFKTLVLSATGVALLTFNACKKEDTTGPVVTLSPLTYTLALNATNFSSALFTATANDDTDGDIAATGITSSNTVNADSTGTYEITFTATDAAGNTGTATAMVYVINEARDLVGTYDGNETDVNGPYVYSGNTNSAKVVTVTASASKNKRVWMTRLGDFANNKVYLDITGSTVDLQSQTVANIGEGSASCDVSSHTFVGSGSKTTDGFTLTYTDTKVAPCSGVRTNVAATFTKK